MGFAAVQATLANLQRNPETRTEPYLPFDFMMWQGPRPTELDRTPTDSEIERMNKIAQQETRILVQAQAEAMQGKTVLVPKKE